MPCPERLTLKHISILLALTAGTILIHGYHFGIEDAAIYIPAIKKALDPRLYTFDCDFFLTQTKPMLFDEAVALIAGLVPLSLEWIVFVLHLASIFLLVYGCFRVSASIFSDFAARWGGVAMVAALITMPVAGTKLYIFDQHLHPRSLATAFLLLAVSDILHDRLKRPLLWLVLSAVMHPQMTAFGLVYCLFLIIRKPLSRLSASATSGLFGILPFMGPAPAAWSEAMATRTHHLLQNWHWYEWLGIFAPLSLLWLLRTEARKINNPRLEFISTRTAAFGALFFAAAVVISINRSLLRFATLQPLRSLQIVYLMLFLLGGGLIGQYVLKHRPLRWLLLFIPVSAAMFLGQRAIFPSSHHIELPFSGPCNKWVEAFDWIRVNTPREAIFVMHPFYMDLDGEDNHGFRAYAERSMVADRMKDAGVSALFPGLADRWAGQVRDLDGWEHFGRADFTRLANKYGVSWAVLEKGHPAADTLECPYRNDRVSVCATGQQASPREIPSDPSDTLQQHAFTPLPALHP